MPTPTEHKTVQARILAYAQEIGWTVVSRKEAERQRGLERGADIPVRYSKFILECNGGQECPPSFLHPVRLQGELLRHESRHCVGIPILSAISSLNQV
jgi:hypothetical protein